MSVTERQSRTDKERRNEGGGDTRVMEVNSGGVGREEERCGGESP